MANKMVVKTHFTDKEMNCQCGCGKTVQPELLVRLEALRLMVATPLVITSGARCAAHNRAVGGFPGSYHLQGAAVDIACDNSDLRNKIINLAPSLGFNGIGVAKTFIHLDMRPAYEGRCWLY